MASSFRTANRGGKVRAESGRVALLGPIVGGQSGRPGSAEEMLLVRKELWNIPIPGQLGASFFDRYRIRPPLVVVKRILSPVDDRVLRERKWFV